MEHFDSFSHTSFLLLFINVSENGKLPNSKSLEENFMTELKTLSLTTCCAGIPITKKVKAMMKATITTTQRKTTKIQAAIKTKGILTTFQPGSGRES